jgi:hypothetical protein
VVEDKLCAKYELPVIRRLATAHVCHTHRQRDRHTQTDLLWDRSDLTAVRGSGKNKSSPIAIGEGLGLGWVGLGLGWVRGGLG